MPTKPDVEKKKAHARELLKQRPLLTTRDIQNLTGLSQSSAHRIKASLSQDNLKGSKTVGIQVPSDPDQKNSEPESDSKTTLEFEASPDPVGQKSTVASAFSSLKGILGIKEGKEAPRPQTSTPVKLTEKQQRFVDATSPTIALGFMTVATAIWSKIGPEYSNLGPDEEVALRIVTPLLRIYARHNTFLVDVNPDVADIGTSLFALVGYVNVSMNLYAQIKKDKEEEYEQSGHYQNGYYRPRNATTTENGANRAGGRYTDVRERDRQDDRSNGANVRSGEDIDSSDFTKEERQHAALLRLSQMDFEHRARRSGRP